MNFICGVIAKILAIPRVADWLIDQAMKTPYYPIVKDGETYMERFWLFNPYESIDGQQMGSRIKWFPWNIRIHWIRLPDQDRHLHDHPWNARTFILKGGYVEQRIADSILGRVIRRKTGDTASLKFGEYHRITSIDVGGVWTLFVSGPYRGTWGFLVGGVKVQWRTYLGLEEKQ